MAEEKIINRVKKMMALANDPAADRSSDKFKYDAYSEGRTFSSSVNLAATKKLGK